MSLARPHACRRGRCAGRPCGRAGFRFGAITGLLFLLGNPSSLAAQMERLPEQGGRIVSLGQPPRLSWFAGVASGARLHTEFADQLTLQVYVGAHRPLLNPVAGIASIGAEGYAGARGTAADGGARVLLRVPYMGLGAGIDYNFRDAFDVIITGYGPVRRGGIIMPGGLLRIDVHPARPSVALGVSLPLGDRYAGRGRPRRDYVAVGVQFEPSVQYRVHEPALEAALDSLQDSAEWMRRLIVPFIDQDGRTGSLAVRRTESYLQDLRARLAVRTANDEIRHFHAELVRAFQLASGSDGAGEELARCARQTMLDEIILPYNRLLGRKKRGDTLEDLATAARGRFSRTVTSAGMMPVDRTDHVLYVFQRVTRLLDEVRRAAASEWNDARLVWLPLQYALLPEDYDEQTELNALIERATGVPFTAHNSIRYVANLQFHYELLRSIRETRDYHVLWVHDFPAVTAQKELDRASLEQLVQGYLATLADRVERYDAVGKLPSYFIFLDEFYYEGRRSRILMDVLEDPLRASASLPRGVRGDVAPLELVLERLRSAVRGSRVLQAEARQYGDAWLRNRVKVHINITNRADPSFWSGALVGTLFSYPDNIMRDHRKVAFRDVSESDPARGEAIFTGMGVGQHYLGPRWEDRSLIVSGSVLLGLKRAARDLLLSQGLKERDLPFAFREPEPGAVPSPGGGAPAAGPLEAGAGDGQWSTTAMLLVNGTGFLPKPINVAKTLLYSLLLPGAVIKIPDSLWNSSFFASLLVGASIRGCTVSLTAPAIPNAPSSGFPQLARAHELLTRLLLVRRYLGDDISAAGGEFRIGLYALPPDRNGFASRAEAWVRHVEAAAPSRAFGPARSTLLPVVAEAAAARRPAPAVPVAEVPEAPKLHQKVQYLATGALWDAIAHSPEWPQFMAAYLRYRAATYAMEPGGEAVEAHGFPGELGRIASRVYAPAAAGARAASYALVGSQNMDYRGMFMDGEVDVLFGGAESLVPLLDLLFLEGTVTWVEDQATLDLLLPPPSELKRRLARVAKDAM